jgi:hypothetical protein
MYIHSCSYKNIWRQIFHVLQKHTRHYTSIYVLPNWYRESTCPGNTASISNSYCLKIINKLYLANFAAEWVANLFCRLFCSQSWTIQNVEISNFITVVLLPKNWSNPTFSDFTNLQVHVYTVHGTTCLYTCYLTIQCKLMHRHTCLSIYLSINCSSDKPSNVNLRTYTHVYLYICP